MSMVRMIVGGVDTHADQHVAAAMEVLTFISECHSDDSDFDSPIDRSRRSSM